MNHKPGPEIVIRPLQAGDESALLGLWRRTMWADPIDITTWRARFLLDQHFDSRNCLIAEQDGIRVGFLLGFDRSVTTVSDGDRDGWIVAFGVDPGHRRRGIGSAMVTTLAERWCADGVARIVVGPWIPGYLTPGVDVAAYPEAIAMFGALRGRELSNPLSMRATLTGYRAADGTTERTARLAAEDLHIRPVTADDILPLIAFLEVHFPHWREDAIGVLQTLFAGDGRHVTMSIALDHGEIVGFAQSRLERFGPFGVDERQRGRGIGAVLLSQTLQAMRAGGFHAAWFLWTSGRAARLYQQHGFEEVRRFSLIGLDLTPQRTNGDGDQT